MSISELPLSTSSPLASAVDSAGADVGHSVRTESDPHIAQFLRAMRLVVFLLVGTATTATILTYGPTLSLPSTVVLIAICAAFAAWAYLKGRDAVRARITGGSADQHRPIHCPEYPGAILYFGAQFVLIWIALWTVSPSKAVSTLWLLLLIPIGLSVILLPRRGVVLVCGACVAIIGSRVYVSYNWEAMILALSQFVLALVFTIVFIQLSVSAEHARYELSTAARNLQAANHRLSEYAVQAEDLSASRERNRVAREIHDSLGHVLTVVNVQLEAAKALLDRDVDTTRDALDKAQALAQQGLREVRNSVATLRSSPLDQRSLDSAIEVLAAENRAAGCETNFRVDGAPRELPPAAALSLYRAAQEGLTNARKHSHARRVELVLDYASADRVRLRVIDDGCGAAAMEGGFGLIGLRERAALLGGTVAVHTVPGGGFELSLETPG